MKKYENRFCEQNVLKHYYDTISDILVLRPCERRRFHEQEVLLPGQGPLQRDRRRRSQCHETHWCLCVCDPFTCGSRSNVRLSQFIFWYFLSSAERACVASKVSAAVLKHLCQTNNDRVQSTAGQLDTTSVAPWPEIRCYVGNNDFAKRKCSTIEVM